MRRRFNAVLFLAAMTLASLSCATEQSQIEAQGLTITLGEQVTLGGALGLDYFPDQSVARIPDQKKLRLLVAAKHSSYLVEGNDLQTLRTSDHVLSPTLFGSFDNGYAGIGGVHRHTDGKLYAFYHAEDHTGMPSLGPGRPSGYYATVAVAESSDDGRSWNKLGPVVVSNKPKDFQGRPEHHARGAGLPSITVDRSGKYLYLYYTDQSFSNPGGMQTSLARADLTTGPPVPGSFSKYFQGAFSEPGISGRESHVLRFRQPRTFAMYASPSFVPSLDRYVAVFNVMNAQEHLTEGATPKISGIYIAHSQDGINWSAPRQLIADYSTFFIGKSVSVAPSLVWDNPQSAKGYLVYGYSPGWGHSGGQYRGTPHYMVGRRIDIAQSGTWTKSSGAEPSTDQHAQSEAQRIAEQMMKQMDKDGDGLIARSEFIGKARFDLIDADQNGFISLDEAIEFHKKRLARQGGGKP